MPQARDWQRNREMWIRVLEKQTGYPDFVTSTADELIDAQYADRPNLRPIYDEIVNAASASGDIIIQARKTCIAGVSTENLRARTTGDEKPTGPRTPSRRRKAAWPVAALDHARDDATPGRADIAR